jgi:hypothetical protein
MKNKRGKLQKMGCEGKRGFKAQKEIEDAQPEIWSFKRGAYE